ncbi:monofunctional biosynthetic peptidoglycan transglycosylase [Pararhodospirillum oryzae]|uniref:Biosynthetic peptidoglycan transglycosylase n=1 Tax=Pararhodospirillum oryzae TaxID=478448 RepID=A0A512HBS6_9PROT|nr:monofunctional biosynthetic peptidoglycan transglycosylase [Pararhodospirillum oryzae]GEO82901.1 monofunctional biosynthetic peptidoglycan transglycosylase [Pararhodospirillum oryzae]
MRREALRPLVRRAGRGLALVLGIGLIAWPLAGLGLGRFLPVPVTPLMIQRLIEGDGLHHAWVSSAALPDALRKAVIASEDARFCQHHGFDWVEVQNAWNDYQRDGRLRGASTLSMQTARTLLLWGGRDVARKGLELWYTVLLEALWPKARILDVYLNIVEWGPGIFGAESAARYYFGVAAADLSATQAARLVAILPNPRIWSAASPSGWVARRAATIRARMGQVALNGSAVCPP